MKIDDNSLLEIEGGGISASLLNYLSITYKTVYNIGQELGGAIRRIATRNLCPL